MEHVRGGLWGRGAEVTADLEKHKSQRAGWEQWGPEGALSFCTFLLLKEEK